jgi:hypothetical protein
MVEKILMGETMVAQFNTGQRKVFDQVMAPINHSTNLLRQFFRRSLWHWEEVYVPHKLNLVC